MEPRYQPTPTEPGAAASVIVSLAWAAQELALQGAGAAQLPSPQPRGAEMRTPEADKRTPDAPPRAEARPSPTAAPAAVTRALSALAQPGRAERLVGAEAARAAKKLGAHLLPSLRLPAIPLPHAIAPPAVAGGRLANTRRLLQIGLALGIAYLVFLSFWFWGTRGRHRGLRRGVRF